MLIRELLDRGDILLVQFDLLEVLRNARWRDRLWNHRVTANLTPCQNHLCRGCALLLGNGLYLRTGNEQRDVEEVVTKGRVRRDVDVLFFGILNQLLARKDWMALNLVDRGHEIRLFD